MTNVAFVICKLWYYTALYLHNFGHLIIQLVRKLRCGSGHVPRTSVVLMTLTVFDPHYRFYCASSIFTVELHSDGSCSSRTTTLFFLAGGAVFGVILCNTLTITMNHSNGFGWPPCRFAVSSHLQAEGSSILC